MYAQLMNEAEYLKWRITEIEVSVIRPRRITPFEISIILHMVQKPSSKIVCYSFRKIIPSLKTWLKHAYLHRSIHVKFIFDSARLGFVQLRKYSLNRRCRPSSYLLAVLAMFLVIFFRLVVTLESSKMFTIFSSSQLKQNLVPRSSRLTVH